MTDGEDADSRLPLSSDELKVLDLYDKLQELRLEIAIINAQSTWKAGELRCVMAEYDGLGLPPTFFFINFLIFVFTHGDYNRCEVKFR